MFRKALKTFKPRVSKSIVVLEIDYLKSINDALILIKGLTKKANKHIS